MNCCIANAIIIYCTQSFSVYLNQQLKWDLATPPPPVANKSTATHNLNSTPSRSSCCDLPQSYKRPNVSQSPCVRGNKFGCSNFWKADKFIVLGSLWLGVMKWHRGCKALIWRHSLYLVKAVLQQGSLALYCHHSEVQGLELTYWVFYMLRQDNYKTSSRTER